MTHIDYDFTTPVGLEITPSDGKKKEKSRKRNTREWREKD